MHRADDGTAVAVKAVFCAVITDLSHGVARKSLEINITLGRYLAHDENKSCRTGYLAGNTGHGILSQQLIKHRIGYFVAQLVGVSLGH